MQHTPYGYDIIGGKAVINEKQADDVRRICRNYLSGDVLQECGICGRAYHEHCGVKRLMLNERYLGDEFYPAILTEETVRKVEAERIRREKALGRDRRKGKGAPKGVYYTGFSALKIAMKYKDPVEQAEYAYSRIRNEVSS